MSRKGPVISTGFSTAHALSQRTAQGRGAGLVPLLVGVGPFPGASRHPFDMRALHEVHLRASWRSRHLRVLWLYAASLRPI